MGSFLFLYLKPSVLDIKVKSLFREKAVKYSVLQRNVKMSAQRTNDMKSCFCAKCGKQWGNDVKKCSLTIFRFHAIITL